DVRPRTRKRHAQTSVKARQLGRQRQRLAVFRFEKRVEGCERCGVALGHCVTLMSRNITLKDRKFNRTSQSILDVSASVKRPFSSAFDAGQSRLDVRRGARPPERDRVRPVSGQSGGEARYRSTLCPHPTWPGSSARRNCCPCFCRTRAVVSARRCPRSARPGPPRGRRVPLPCPCQDAPTVF